MSKTSTSREYELVNAAAAQDEIQLREEEDGVWTHMTVGGVPSSPSRMNSRRRRKAILALILCALGVAVIVAFRGGKHKSTDKTTSVPATSTEATNKPNVDVAPPPPSPTAAAKTQSPTDAAAPPTLAAKYNCQGERIPNGEKLKTDHFLCDSDNRFRFGMDSGGNLIYADDDFNMTAFVYNGTKGDYFKMLDDGTFTVCNRTGDVVWKESCGDNVSFSAACLSANHKAYDCPYLHLHSGGTVVLNWINHEGDWKERNILHMYNLPECKDHFFCYP